MAKAKGSPKTGGRKPGTPNKLTVLIKDAIVGAATKAGGAEGLEGFLLKQALKENNAPFMGLLGRVMPTQIGAEDSDDQLVVVLRKFSPHDEPE